jgi:hypothetical protein
MQIKWRSLISSFSKIMGRFMVCMKSSIYGFMQSRLDYRSVWNYPITVGVSASYRISANVWNGLRASENAPFMSSCKVGLVSDQYGWKSEFPDNSYRRSPVENINKRFEMVYALQEEVYLMHRACVSSALWRITKAENKKFATNF